LKRDSEVEPRIVCHCFHKTREDLRAEILRLKLRDLEEAVLRLSAGNGCTLCRPDIEVLIHAVTAAARVD